MDLDETARDLTGPSELSAAPVANQIEIKRPGYPYSHHFDEKSSMQIISITSPSAKKAPQNNVASTSKKIGYRFYNQEGNKATRKPPKKIHLDAIWFRYRSSRWIKPYKSVTNFNVDEKNIFTKTTYLSLWTLQIPSFQKYSFEICKNEQNLFHKLLEVTLLFL